MKTLRLWLATSLILIVVASTATAAPTVRDVCKDAGDADFPCTHSSIASADAVSASGDIIEIRDSDTYNEKLAPSSTRTLRNKAGDTPTIGGSVGNAIDLDNIGTGALTIISNALLDITLTSSANETIEARSGAGGFTLVVEGVLITNTKNNNGAMRVDNGTENVTVTFKKCVIGPGQGANAKGLFVTTTGSGSSFNFENTYIHDFSGEGIRIDEDKGAGNIIVDLKGVTIRNVGEAIRTASRIAGKHVLLQDNGGDFLETGSFVKSDFTFSGFEEEPTTGWPASIQNGSSVFDNVSDSTVGYVLSNGSFGVDDGDTTGIADDIVGTSRPQNTDFDFGCFEQLAAVVGIAGALSLLGVGM